jgi:signal transduction histidine kinase
MHDSFRILAVDDNANNLFALRTLLERMPEIEIVEAASGEEALLRTIETEIDLILLDVQMPGMDGFETARHLQMTERTRKIPVVFLTAVFKTDEFIRQGFEVGAVDYFTKPLDENLLLSRVKLYMNLLQRERRLNEAVELLRQREQAMVSALELAESANRAKSTFLSNMSHELRTPLTAVIGLSHLMARSVNLNEAERKNLEIINRSGNHLLSLINDVLEMSKIEAGRVELLETAADVGSLAREVVELLRNRAEQQGLILAAEIEGVPAALRVDAGKLRQILVNLVGNAIKFTHQGEISLSVKAIPLSDAAVRLSVAVRDTGIGIASEDKERIFEPFAQMVTHATTSGTGLGLSVSRQYLRMMGSELAIDSKPGVGSTFAFNLILPLASEPSANPPASGLVIALEETDRGAKILVVEDNEDARYMLLELLTPLGFDVQVAEDGARAVDMAREFCPRLILMDWRMPKLSGLEAARRILDLETENPPRILMVSANVFEEQRQQALAAGIHAFLMKPLQEDELYAALETHLNIRFCRETNPTMPMPAPSEAELTAADLDVLPAFDRIALAEAICEVNPAKLRVALQGINVQFPVLAARLKAMLEAARHRELWTLLGEV